MGSSLEARWSCLEQLLLTFGEDKMVRQSAVMSDPEAQYLFSQSLRAL